MNIHRFESIPFEIDIPYMLEKMNIIRENKRTDEIVGQLLEGAQIAVPKAIYGQALIQKRGEDYLVADEIRFNSRILRINTQKTDWLYPYLATAGRELEAWSERFSSPMERYVASLIEEEACRKAMTTVFQTIDTPHELQFPSSMNPGSLEDWPLSEQRNLFKLLKDSHGTIGIELLDSLFMKPAKSVSGIRFSGIHAYTNCQICTRHQCDGRMEPYDPDAERRYQ